MVRKIKIEDRIAYFLYENSLTIRDLEAFVGMLAELETELPYSPYRLSDLSQVEHFELNYSSIDHFAKMRKCLVLKNPVRSAIVAPSPLHFGYARMYAAINLDPRVTIRIFAQPADAILWLRSDLPQS